MTKLIFALDVPTKEKALDYVQLLSGTVDIFKIGLQLFLKYGPAIVEKIGTYSPIFLDLKLHDIPVTVKQAILSLNGLPVELLTIHGSGGKSMLTHAKEATIELTPSPKLLGVTVLTSLNDQDLFHIGCCDSPQNVVIKRINLLQETGINGAVCSPLELPKIRPIVHDSFLLVTPGIRPKNSQKGDQSRTATPSFAAKMGASHIVVGRPIRDSKDPLMAAELIKKELESVNI